MSLFVCGGQVHKKLLKSVHFWHSILTESFQKYYTVALFMGTTTTTTVLRPPGLCPGLPG